MSLRTVNRHTRKFGRGMLIQSQCIRNASTKVTSTCSCQPHEQSYLLQINYYTEEAICWKLRKKKKNKTNYNWRLAKQEYVIARWDLNTKSKHLLVPVLHWHKFWLIPLQKST